MATTNGGEPFQVERAAAVPAGVGMPWLADAVADAPRRQHLRTRPAMADADVSVETVEAALAMMPDVKCAVVGAKLPQDDLGGPAAPLVQRRTES